MFSILRSYRILTKLHSINKQFHRLSGTVTQVIARDSTVCMSVSQYLHVWMSIFFKCLRFKVSQEQQIRVTFLKLSIKVKSKVYYGHEPPSGECWVNYQILAVIYWSSPKETNNWSWAQLATDNGVRDGRSNWLVAPPTLMGSTPWASRVYINGCNLSSTGNRSCNFSMRD